MDTFLEKGGIVRQVWRDTRISQIINIPVLDGTVHETTGYVVPGIGWDGTSIIPPPDNESKWDGSSWVPDQVKIDAKIAQQEQSAIDSLINQKMKDLAITELKKEGKLTANGKIKK